MDANEVTHLDVIKRLTSEERSRLCERSDARGLVHLAGHLALISLTGTYILLGFPAWQLVMIPHGVFLIFLFTLLHETTHDTPFRSLWLNRAVGWFCGFVIILPPLWFRYFHLAHHRHTHDPEKDPELELPKPQTFGQYAWYMSGISVWKTHLGSLLNVAFGQNLYAYVPAAAKGRTKREARIFTALYVMIAAAGFYFSLTWLIWLWIIPALLGQPFLRAYLLAEHTLCPNVANMLENSRTTYTGAFIRFLAWNMPYHAEHHAYPVVPFYRLPELHGFTQEHLQVTEDGYVGFHRKYVGEL